MAMVLMILLNSTVMRMAAPKWRAIPMGTLADALDTDADDDAVLDETDNCRLNANTQQEDFDLDGFGDVCDSDADGDGFEALGDCDDMNPFMEAPLAGTVIVMVMPMTLAGVRTILRTYNSEWPRPGPRQYCELPNW